VEGVGWWCGLKAKTGLKATKDWVGKQLKTGLNGMNEMIQYRVDTRERAEEGVVRYYQHASYNSILPLSPPLSKQKKTKQKGYLQI
jgi:hypothetical protein